MVPRCYTRLILIHFHFHFSAVYITSNVQEATEYLYPHNIMYQFHTWYLVHNTRESVGARQKDNDTTLLIIHI